MTLFIFPNDGDGPVNCNYICITKTTNWVSTVDQCKLCIENIEDKKLLKTPIVIQDQKQSTLFILYMAGGGSEVSTDSH